MDFTLLILTYISGFWNSHKLHDNSLKWQTHVKSEWYLWPLTNDHETELTAYC